MDALRIAILPNNAISAFPPMQPSTGFPQGKVSPKSRKWFRLNASLAVLLCVVGVMSLILIVRTNDREVPPSGMAEIAASSTPRVGNDSSIPHAWPAFMGDFGHSGSTSDSGPTGEIDTLWRFEAAASFLAPIRAGDMVIASTSAGQVYAIDAKSGEQQWAFETGVVAVEPQLFGIPMAARDLVYWPAQDGQLYALELETGAVRWSFDTGAKNDYLSSPVLSAGNVIVLNGRSQLVAVNAGTGQEAWRVQTSRSPATILSTDPETGLVYLSSERGRLYAFDPITGATVWWIQVGVTAQKTPIVAGGSIYVASYDNELHVFDTATGASRWSYSGTADADTMPPAISGGLAVSGTRGIDAFALDASTGEERWRLSIPLATSPVIADDVVYLIDVAGDVVALDLATGTELGRGHVGDVQLYAPPAISTRTLYVAGADGTVSAHVSDSVATKVNRPRVTGEAAAMSAVTSTFEWSTQGNSEQRLSRPGFAAMDANGHIWVASMPGTFLIFDENGLLTDVFGSPGSGAGEFSFESDQVGPWGSVTFAPDGGFFVADTGNARIQQFDDERHFIREWGSFGYGEGQFLAPTSIAFDDSGNLLVADSLRNDVQRFDLVGRFLGTFGGGGILRDHISGIGAITSTSDGTVWIPGTDGNFINIYDQDGIFVRRVVLIASDPRDRFNYPVQVAQFQRGIFLVVDKENHVVRVVDSDGHLLGEFGGVGSGFGAFSYPGAIVVGADGAIYVVDAGNDRLQKFRLKVDIDGATSMATPDI